ncbi:Uncharacterised protein [Halioglobus japonicus]|nr:Uncharacterised protein [Halioglobus japonicus]
MTVKDDMADEGKTEPETDLSRRNFVKQSSKALYIAPTLTVLGSAPASAQFGSPPPPPGTAPAPPEPGR